VIAEDFERMADTYRRLNRADAPLALTSHVYDALDECGYCLDGIRRLGDDTPLPRPDMARERAFARRAFPQRRAAPDD
jgi:hypothetical protein